MKKYVLLLIIAITIIFFLIKTFNDFATGISPNNQVDIIDYQNSQYETDILSRYIDTFLVKHKDYNAKKHGYTIDSSLDFLSLRNIYFSSSPAEIYTIRGDYLFLFEQYSISQQDERWLFMPKILKKKK